MVALLIASVICLEKSIVRLALKFSSSLDKKAASIGWMGDGLAEIMGWFCGVLFCKLVEVELFCRGAHGFGDLNRFGCGGVEDLYCGFVLSDPSGDM